MKPPAGGSSSQQSRQLTSSETARLPDRTRRGPSLVIEKHERPAAHFASLRTNAAGDLSNVSSRNEDWTPRKWSECFQNSTDLALKDRGGVWRVYDAGLDSSSDLALVLLHGGGHCALSWSLVAEILKEHVAVIAFDARGHGHSTATDETQLSAEAQVADAALLIKTFFAQKRPDASVPRLVICGHSMGGAIAVRLAAANVIPEVVGLVVIDVVEGTAMSALPYMKSWLRSRPTSFPSEASAVRYVTKAGHVKNPASARMSVPAQITYNESIKRWMWRTDLEETEKYWKEWFEGLSALFLSVPAAKMLILANVDRLDRDLMIAQMQGKFQNILIPAAGHSVHEDQPGPTARAILEYLRRNLFISSEGIDVETNVFQQRTPVPP